jgi:hypothetical protein
VKRAPIVIDPTRCEVCGESSDALRPRHGTGLRACPACFAMGSKELAETYCRRIERRD